MAGAQHHRATGIIHTAAASCTTQTRADAARLPTTAEHLTHLAGVAVTVTVGGLAKVTGRGKAREMATVKGWAKVRERERDWDWERVKDLAWVKGTATVKGKGRGWVVALGKGLAKARETGRGVVLVTVMGMVVEGQGYTSR